jgi:hypothetical protein
MKALLVVPAKVPKAWPYVEHWIKAALARGSDNTPEEIQEHLAKGTMQLWLAWDDKPVGVCITELTRSVRGKCCNIVIVAGERFDAWRHLEEDVAIWACDQGCVRLQLIGRRGWTRRLGNGWKPTQVMMEKSL